MLMTLFRIVTITLGSAFLGTAVFAGAVKRTRTSWVAGAGLIGLGIIGDGATLGHPDQAVASIAASCVLAAGVLVYARATRTPSTPI